MPELVSWHVGFLVVHASLSMEKHCPLTVALNITQVYVMLILSTIALIAVFQSRNVLHPV